MSQSTILVHLHAPLDEQHALDHIKAIRTHDTPLAEASDDELVWEIRNKYYSASVTFKVVNAVQPDSDEPAVIVLAPRSPSPPDSLKVLLAQHSARASEYEIALLVAYPLSPSAAALTTDDDAWDDLALEHGFEWVDLAVGNGGSRIEADGEDRIGEQTGVARVVAALHAHMWEGMVQAPRAVTSHDEERSTRLDDDEDDEDFSALGAPPLPEPRPFVPTPVAFPSTFLPSLSTNGASCSFSLPAPTLTAISPPAPRDDPPPAFDDDFADFATTLPRDITAFPPLTTSSLTPSSSFPSPDDLPSALYRHPALSFPDALDDEPVELDDEAAELDADALDDLVEKPQGFRAEADGMQSMEERRAFAERVVGGLGLLGA